MADQDFQARAGRIRIVSLKGVKYVFEEEPSVINLSFTGLGLAKSEIREVPPVGERITGNLRFPDEEFRLPIEIVSDYERVLAASYRDPTGSIKTYLKGHYAPELAALGLRKVENTQLKEQADGHPHWYFDGYDCELYFVEKDHQLVRYRIAFLGNYLVGKPGHAPRFGTYGPGITVGVHMPGSKIIHDKDAISPKTVDSILKFLAHIENLDEEYRAQIIHSVQMMARLPR